jgi:hypothetical protein
MWQAEIRTMWFLASLGKNKFVRSHLNRKKLGIQTPVPPKKKKKGTPPGWPGQKERPYLQNKQSKKSWRHAHVVECLPSKHKALSSNPRTAKEKELCCELMNC